MSEQSRRNLSLTGLFAAFMFLQYTVLGAANHAGEGYLSTERREWIYYGLQLFVILGFLVYAFSSRLRWNDAARRRVSAAVLALFAAGGLVMLLTPNGSPFYLAVTFGSMPCLGYLGGMVYHRMSIAADAGLLVARSMGIGCAAAISLQYFLQLQWGATPLLPVCLAGAAGLLAVLLRRSGFSRHPTDRPATGKTVPWQQLLFACLITVGLLCFVGFYNETIHHLQVRSGYEEANVYSWPRLLMIPGFLLFAALGDRRQGRLVPVMALCCALVALLNAVLTKTYWLNMCLFYIALSGVIAYYDLTFWRLASGTKRPAFWASAGRLLDSGNVLLLGGLQSSLLPMEVVLIVDVAVLATVILLLAVSGGFTLWTPAERPEPIPAVLTPEETLDRMREHYALTPRETEVLRELVLTEDKQAVISQRLGIQIKVLQKYVTQLYRKTGAATRSGLTELYHTAMLEREG